MTFVRVTQAARILGIHPVTLRKWIKEGKVINTFNASGQRVFDTDYLNGIMAKNNVVKPVTVFYVRTSGKNDNSLKSQKEYLTSTYGEPNHVYSDTGSGLNSNRKQLNRMLDDAKAGKFTEIVVTHKDRLSRFGVEYIERLLSDCNVNLVCDSTNTDEPHEVLMNDFMSLIASFSGKFYSMRGLEQKKKLLKKAEEELKDD